FNAMAGGTPALPAGTGSPPLGLRPEVRSMSLARGFGFTDAERQNAEVLIEAALAEDLDGYGDLTAVPVIPASARGSTRLVARGEGVLAGLPVVEMVVEQF